MTQSLSAMSEIFNSPVRPMADEQQQSVLDGAVEGYNAAIESPEANPLALLSERLLGVSPDHDSIETFIGYPLGLEAARTGAEVEIFDPQDLRMSNTGAHLLRKGRLRGTRLGEGSARRHVSDLALLAIVVRGGHIEDARIPGIVSLHFIAGVADGIRQARTKVSGARADKVGARA